MSPEMIAEIYRNAMWTTMLLGAPVLGVTLVIGTGVSLLQAATQVNEMTLTFIPKAAGAGLVLWLSSGWLMDQWSAYTIELFTVIENVSGTF